jgi:hypothetical protein
MQGGQQLVIKGGLGPGVLAPVHALPCGGPRASGPCRAQQNTRNC